MKSTDSLDSFSWYHSFALSANAAIFLNNHSRVDCQGSSKTGNLLCIKPRHTCVLKFQKYHKTHRKLPPSTHYRLLNKITTGWFSEPWLFRKMTAATPFASVTSHPQSQSNPKLHNTWMHHIQKEKKRNRISPVCKFQRQKETKKTEHTNTRDRFHQLQSQSQKEITVTVLIHVKY